MFTIYKQSFIKIENVPQLRSSYTEFQYYTKKWYKIYKKTYMRYDMTNVNKTVKQKNASAKLLDNLVG